MEKQEMELYHIHKLGNSYDRKWSVNNTINVSQNFNSEMFKRQMNFSQSIFFDGKMRNFYELLPNYIEYLSSTNSVSIEELRAISELLRTSFAMSYKADFFKREAALEDCRKDYDITLPSRLHSIYLCDEDGLEYWKDTLEECSPNGFDAYKVLVTGKIFKTNEQLLPDEEASYGDVYNQAFKYWHPKFKDVPGYTNEYLAQGEIKILSKVK